MNPIEGLFSTFGSWQAAASADANATDMMKSVGRKSSGVGSGEKRTFKFLICQKFGQILNKFRQKSFDIF